MRENRIGILLASEQFDQAAAEIAAFAAERNDPRLAGETAALLQSWLELARAQRAHLAQSLAELTAARQYCTPDEHAGCVDLVG